jgi:hypothetical protein
VQLHLRDADRIAKQCLYQQPACLRRTRNLSNSGLPQVASEHYSTAMLEKLMHGSGQLPPNQHFIKMPVLHNGTYEMLNTADYLAVDRHQRF